MKFNEDTIKQCTEQMCEDLFWDAMYKNAPDGARKRLEIAFWGSKAIKDHEDMDAYRARREQVEKEMSYDDVAYLAKEFPAGAGKDHYRELCERKRFAPFKTPEKLNRAIDVMVADAPEDEREAIEATRALIDAESNPFVDDDLLWASVGGNGDRCHLLGDIFDHGHDVATNEDLAFFWFKRGAMAGDGDCCCRLAALYENEESRRFDFALATFWYQEALRRKNQMVKWMLAYRLIFGKGAWEDHHNPTLGFELLCLGLDSDTDGEVPYYLGMCYEQGAGTAKDRREALRFYRISNARGHAGAREALERMKHK